MISHLCKLAFAATLVLPSGGVGAAATMAAPSTTSSVSATAAWIRQPPPAAKVAAGYVQLRNHGSDDRLLAARSDAFAQVQIHAMRMDGEMMRMHALPEGLALPAGRRVELKPGSYHLMLMTPRQPLHPGQQIRVQLQFLHAGTLQMEFVVRDEMAGEGAGS